MIDESYVNGVIKRYLRPVRKRSGLKQIDVGEAIGCGQNYISHIELGRRAPSLIKLMRLCDCLGVTPNDLLGYSDTIRD